MFDLSNVPGAIKTVVRYLLRLLGPTSGPMDASRGPRKPVVRTQGDRTALRCFQDTQPGRPVPPDCAEFYQPDGRLIWEEGARADV